MPPTKSNYMSWWYTISHTIVCFIQNCCCISFRYLTLFSAPRLTLLMFLGILSSRLQFLTAFLKKSYFFCRYSICEYFFFISCEWLHLDLSIYCSYICISSFPSWSQDFWCHPFLLPCIFYKSFACSLGVCCYCFNWVPRRFYFRWVNSSYDIHSFLELLLDFSLSWSLALQCLCVCMAFLLWIFLVVASYCFIKISFYDLLFK